LFSFSFLVYTPVVSQVAVLRKRGVYIYATDVKISPLTSYASWNAGKGSDGEQQGKEEEGRPRVFGTKNILGSKVLGSARWMGQTQARRERES
jgi:hypothetical protein